MTNANNILVGKPEGKILFEKIDLRRGMSRDVPTDWRSHE
jgi:hypothetical protein